MQSIFDDDDSYGMVAAVSQSYESTLNAEVGGPFMGATAPMQSRPTSGLVADFNLRPCDSVANACAKSLRTGLLCGEAGSEALGGVAFALAINDLSRAEDAAEEAVAKAIDAGGNTRDFDEVGT